MHLDAGIGSTHRCHAKIVQARGAGADENNTPGQLLFRNSAIFDVDRRNIRKTPFPAPIGHGDGQILVDGYFQIPVRPAYRQFVDETRLV